MGSRGVPTLSSEISLCKIAKLVPNKRPQLLDYIDGNLFCYAGRVWEKTFDFDAEKMIEVVNCNKGRLCFCQTGQDDLVLAHNANPTAKYRPKNSENWLYSEIFLNYNANFDNITESDSETDYGIISNLTDKLYEDLKEAHAQSNKLDLSIKLPPLPKQFVPVLRKYQERSIRWLYQREISTDTIKHFYREIFAKDNETQLHINIFDSIFRSEKNPPTDIEVPPGGILAEEMGLGKTVEMLAIILLNARCLTDSKQHCTSIPLKRRKIEKKSEKIFCICLSTKKRNLIECTNCHLSQHFDCVCKYEMQYECSGKEHYMCPKCWENETELIMSGATFIVSPNSIKLQWLSEIEKHTSPPLRVHLYEGVSKGWISPRQLASYDIILTDYTTLQKEFYYTSESLMRYKFRSKPKFMRAKSPVLKVEWWRVCLDEAQMVENTEKNVAKMVRLLPAVIRWAVTGTPIQNSIDDIQGLLNFIGLDGFDESANIWPRLIQEFTINPNHSKHLIRILQKCMWRTCKIDVIEQLNIPPQSEIVHFVRLNNFETLYYGDQHTVCESSFNKQIKKYSLEDKTSSQMTHISQTIIKNVLQPFLRIRQCCTMPVYVNKNFQSYAQKNTNVQFLQPKELHKHMRLAAEHNCKLELRTMASSYNGLAAIYFIKNNYDEAIKHYEFVLKLARDYADQFSVDTLLQIHALHNSIEAYNLKTTDTEQKKIISKYRNECINLEKKYLETYITNLLATESSYEKALETRKKTETMSQHTLEELAEIIINEIILISNDAENQLISKINDELRGSFDIDSINSSSSILFTIHIWYDKLIATQKQIANKLQKLQFFINGIRSGNPVQLDSERDQLIRDAYDCHLYELHNSKQKNDQQNFDREKEKTKNEKILCQFCILKNDINNYECLIFDKTLDKETNQAEGLGNPSRHITLLKALLLLHPKKKFHHQKYSAEIKLHLDIMNCLRIEYRELIKFWIEIEYTVKAYDELNMCKMRLSLAKNKEEQSNFKIAKHEVGGVFLEQTANLQEAQNQFALKFARLKYVKHLESKSDPGSCPICRSNDHTQYTVFECGHHSCLFCLNQMIKLQRCRTITCAICRNIQSLPEIYFVTRNHSNDNLESIEIRGEYSSKINAIVRLVLKLIKSNQKEDPPKIIIFSHWEPILSAIEKALRDNGIFTRLNWSPKSIEDFKNPELNITCLLMLLSNGSKGLNLVEATHVFLVEPIINISEELQAIGRVHRIGQTKPTTVHRFIVENTIEENIYNAVVKKKECTITIDSIKSLFHLNTAGFRELSNCTNL